MFAEKCAQKKPMIQKSCCESPVINFGKVEIITIVKDIETTNRIKNKSNNAFSFDPTFAT
jgi:hypothetical protein